MSIKNSLSAGMASALQLDLPWFNLQKTLVVADADGMVNYIEFLQYTPELLDGPIKFAPFVLQ